MPARNQVKKALIRCLLLSGFLVVAACGQNGPLRLPEDTPPAEEPVGQAPAIGK